MKRIHPRDIEFRISDRGGRAVVLTITDVMNEKFVIPFDADYADEVGREILAGALALNGRLA